jgi:adenylate cyclase
MGSCHTKAVADWLVNGARPAADTPGVLSELCDRLLGCGIPIGRVGLFVLTLHPHVMGQRFLWKPGSPMDVNSAPFEAFQTEEFQKSPVRRVIDTGVPVRRRLADKDCPIDLTMLPQLRKQGVTDYLAVPLIFADGAAHGATFATSDPHGFTDEQVSSLTSIAAPLSRVVENRMLQRTACALLDTYVGNKGGERILAGQIRRGHVDVMNAVIWFSDMRGFTSLSDRLEPQALVDLLNRYFDCQVPSILDRGGEVLEYMGDGLLAVFLIAPDGDNARKVCRSALEAAREARDAIARLSTRLKNHGESYGSEEHGVHGVQFGLALHLGQVSYGNIGSRNRLKFTCVGPAMNLAARIEGLTSPLHRAILASDEFARQCPSEFVPVGEFDLKGFATTRTVFGLEEETKQSVPYHTNGIA